MDHSLYYCEHWEHKEVNIKDRKYSVCISPKINGNKPGTVIQFHGVIMQDEKVARIGTINNNISKEQANILLNDLEERLRSVIYAALTWEKNTLDRDTVKIWYYEKKDTKRDSDSEDKRIYPPLRFTVTSININSLDNNKSNSIKDSLEKVLVEWLNKIMYE